MTYRGPSSAQRKTDEVFATMRDFAMWHSRRDEIISQALALEVPVERIAMEMGISASTVRAAKQRLGREKKR